MATKGAGSLMFIDDVTAGGNIRMNSQVYMATLSI